MVLRIPIPRAALVSPLPSPSSFAHHAQSLIATALRRISISSLYLGTGPHEQTLCDTLFGTLSRNVGLRCTAVLDHSRARRSHPKSSIGMLSPLLSAHPERLKVHLLRMPQFHDSTDYLARNAPSPFDEAFGVSHAKVRLWAFERVEGGGLLKYFIFIRRFSFLGVPSSRSLQ